MFQHQDRTYPTAQRRAQERVDLFLVLKVFVFGHVKATLEIVFARE